MQLTNWANLRSSDFSASYHLPRIAFVLIALAGAAALGLVAALPQLEFLSVVLAVAVLGVSLILVVGYRIWWWGLVVVLVGNFALSRGFAGIGVFPVFITEAVLVLGVPVMILGLFSNRVHFHLRPFANWLMLILLGFLVWSVLQTVPHFGTYQFNALRDAMGYGYALFTPLIMLLIPRHRVVWFFESMMPKLIPVAVLWYPIFFVIIRANIQTPQLPFMDVPILTSKATDLPVHLAGLGSFLALQLYARRHNYPLWLTWFYWGMWTFAVLLVSMTGRAAMLCSVAALGITFLLSPIKSRLEKPILILVIAIVVLLVTGGYSSLAIDLGHSRQISPEQLVENIMSIFGEGDNSAGGLEQTKQWRLRWWDTIINYTFNGPYFWTGKGYGINLANSDGFQVLADDLLRAPHNAALTILARSGVPGFGFWVIFMVGYMLFLLRIALFERKSRPKQVAIAIWLLAYMAAFHIMAFFDVFLEGPMGGAWLWSLIGMSFVYFGRHKDEEPANMVTAERAS